MEALEKQLEVVAAELVTVDAELPQAMAALHDKFMEIEKIVGDDTDSISRIAKASGDYLEKIILKEVEIETGMRVLGEAVSAMQQVVRDKREISEVVVPDELGLDIGGRGKSAPREIENEEETVQDKAQDETPGSEEENPPETQSQPEPQSSAPEPEPEEESEQSFVLDLGDADQTLIAEFITEAREHCANAEQLMMDLETGDDLEGAINGIFRSFHSIKGAAGFLDLTPVLVLAHESETLLDMARKGTLAIEGMIADTVFDSIDSLRTLFDCIEEVLDSGQGNDVTDKISGLLLKLKRIINNQGPLDGESVDEGKIEEAAEEEEESSGVSDAAPKRLGELLVEAGEIDKDELDDILAEQKDAEYREKVGHSLVKGSKVPARKVAQALREQQSKKDKPASGNKAVKEMVKIDTERLDRLIDTIGELVIAESMVGQDEQILALDSPHVTRNISHLNKITRELQEMGMAMRLVPVKPTFQKLARAVRDLTKKSGKKINLVIYGEDTEVDRSIVENVGDPLMHMVRNSVDHGIEPPEDRVAKGKEETGTIKLSAYHKGGNLYFDIEDDGKGLDKEKIMQKAREKGLVDPGKELTDKEIYNLIFHPGFSTAAKITDVSGRGVGMDVVKRNIESMRGYMEIESEPGKGSKFSMRLPLTLAIIDGMLVSVGRERFIIPTLSVVESLRLTSDIIYTVENRAEMINLRGSLLPLIRIDKLLNLKENREGSSNDTVVVVEDAHQRAGLVIDELLGQRQTVIKSLGSVFEDQKWISGGAILSNGRIGLIIDVSGIIKLAKTEGYTATLPMKELENLNAELQEDLNMNGMEEATLSDGEHPGALPELMEETVEEAVVG
ncbi:MAG: chemotaxis protein CheA [candidate division Zixibacteria bacterium]|nr:chemotaxis protein CheA [candidate division Zixibacteria bacterium]